jgi:hypothetical protein
MVRCVKAFLILVGMGVASVVFLDAMNGHHQRISIANRLVASETEGSATSKVDPLAILDEWPEPDLLLTLSGRQHGYIEPCGCTGLENAKGGLSRRHNLFRRLEKGNWSLLKLDVGNQVRRFGRQAEIKFHTTIDCLRLMKYDVIGFGPDDLRLSFNELLSELANSDKEFVCANVSLLEINSSFRVFDTGGRRIGVTAMLGQQARQKINNSEIEMKDTDESLQKAVRDLREAKADVLVLLAHADLEETRQLAKKFSDFDLIVTAGGAGEPTLHPEIVQGTNTQIIQVGTKGMYVGIVGLYADKNRPVRYARVELDARFEDSPEILEIFANYQYQLQVHGFDGLGIKPVKHPRSDRTFVGSESCGECHTSAYDIWKKTPHFDATRYIHDPTERSEIPRHFDPECISCHVTGWNPQEYLPYVSGYESFEASTLLHGNGCENCHGPGSAHVAAENGDIDVSEAEKEKLQLEMRLTLDQAKNKLCFECHDFDNSPDFNEEGAFEEYWDQIKHYGTE